MDRFVWFVLLVVFSHLVTEFTRVTGYTRGSRHDSVMVNDSSIRPIKVQSQIQYPGQESGHYDPTDPQYYNNGNNLYNNYNNNDQQLQNANSANSNTNSNSNSNSNSNNNNIFTNFFNGLFNQNNNNNNNNNVNTNNGLEFPQMGSIIDLQSSAIRTFGFVRPIIDSIFDIPISTLRAVNNLVGRLTFSYRQQQQQLPPQQQPQQQQQQQQYLPPPMPQPNFYGSQRSASIEPKSEFETFKRMQQKDTVNKDLQKISEKPTIATTAATL